MDGLNRKRTGTENSRGKGSPPVEDSCIAQGRQEAPDVRALNFIFSKNNET